MKKRILLIIGIIIIMISSYYVYEMYDSAKGITEDVQIEKNKIKDNLNTVGKQIKQEIKIDGMTIIFPNDKIFKTNIYNLEYIGKLECKDKEPYLILSGKQCNECDANISIYIHNPSDGELKQEYEQTRYGYPGKLLDFLNDKLLSETRMFYGEVLPNKYGVIWYQKKIDINGNWKNSVYFEELKIDSLIGNFLDLKIEITLNQVRKGLAKELEGIELTSEP